MAYVHEENKMLEKDPATYDLLTYAWVFVLSAWGGAVNFMTKLKRGHVRAFNIVEFLGELFISAFSGLLTFYLCEASNIGRLHEAVLVAISGHMGARLIILFERYLERYFGSKISPLSNNTGD